MLNALARYSVFVFGRAVVYSPSLSLAEFGELKFLGCGSNGKSGGAGEMVALKNDSEAMWHVIVG